mgnify:CR=1 FL=1
MKTKLQFLSMINQKKKKRELRKNERQNDRELREKYENILVILTTQIKE